LDLDSPVSWQEMYPKPITQQQRLMGGALTDVDLDRPTVDPYKPTQRNERLFAARVYQRELLSVIATLLRHEKFEPLLKSDIEARYNKLLKGEKDPQAPPPSDYERYGLYMPYTPELRQEIRGFASEFLKQPPDKRDPVSSVAGK